MAAIDREKKEAAEGPRPGVVVGSIDDATRRFTPRFMLLEFKPSIEWLGEHKTEMGPRAFQVQVCLPHPYHETFIMHGAYNSQTDAVLRLLVPRVCPGALPVYVHLFLNRVNEQQQLCNYRAATAFLTVQDLMNASVGYDPRKVSLASFTMYNVLMERQCMFHMKQTHFPMPSMAVWSNATPPGYPALEWYTTTPTDRMPRLKQVEVTAGLMPSSRVADAFRRTEIPFMNNLSLQVWAWCMLHERGAHDMYAAGDETVTDAYLEHAATTSLGWLDLSPEDWVKNPHTDKGFEVLSQVCGFFAWRALYLFDKTYVPDQKRFKSFDQFAMARDKPLWEITSGDCEDTSKDMVMTFRAILRRAKRKTPLSPIIRTLLSLAQGYCCFTMDASIFSKSGQIFTEVLNDDPKEVTLHMYVVLHPWSRVVEMLKRTGRPKEAEIAKRIEGVRDEATRTRGWPALSLESTELNISNWNIHLPNNSTFVERANLAASTAAERAVLSTMSFHNTGKSLMQSQFYRMDLCGYSIELYELYGIHSMLPVRPTVDGKQWTYGVPKEEMMDSKCPTGWVVAGFASYEAMKAVWQLTDRLPLMRTLDVRPREIITGSLPRHLRPAAAASASKAVRLFTRAWDWTAAKQEVLIRVLEKAKYRLVNPALEVEIAEECRIIQLDIESVI